MSSLCTASSGFTACYTLQVPGERCDNQQETTDPPVSTVTNRFQFEMLICEPPISFLGLYPHQYQYPQQTLDSHWENSLKTVVENGFDSCLFLFCSRTHNASATSRASRCPDTSMGKLKPGFSSLNTSVCVLFQ